MLWWGKVRNWCFHHWRLLVVVAIGLIAFLAGKRNAAKYRMQVQLIKDLYEKENEILEEAHANKSSKKQKAVETYREAIKTANRKYIKSRDELEKKRAARVAELVEANKNDPDAIDSIFEKEFGFKISEKK
jgi:hypothetical protein